MHKFTLTLESLFSEAPIFPIEKDSFKIKNSNIFGLQIFTIDTNQMKSLQWLQKVGCLKKRAINLWPLTSWTFFWRRAPRLANCFCLSGSLTRTLFVLLLLFVLFSLLLLLVLLLFESLFRLGLVDFDGLASCWLSIVVLDPLAACSLLLPADVSSLMFDKLAVASFTFGEDISASNTNK